MPFSPYSETGRSSSLRLALSRSTRSFVHQTLAFDFLDSVGRPNAVADLALVVLEVQLGEVEIGVLPADVMVRTVDRPLAIAEKAFCGIRGDQPASFGITAILTESQDASG